MELKNDKQIFFHLEEEGCLVMLKQHLAYAQH